MITAIDTNVLIDVLSPDSPYGASSTRLIQSERPVNDLAHALRITPSRASKHLRVLRQVGLVRVRGSGQRRLYALEARGLKPIHAWVGGFEQFWSGSLDRLNEYVQELERKEKSRGIRS